MAPAVSTTNGKTKQRMQEEIGIRYCRPTPVLGFDSCEILTPSVEFSGDFEAKMLAILGIHYSKLHIAVAHCQTIEFLDYASKSSFFCVVMGRRKQVRPHRSGGILERQSSEAEFKKDDDSQPRKADLIDVEEPFYVEVERSSWDSEEHYDVSEIVLVNLMVNEEFYGYKLTEELYRDSRCFLRFRLSNVNEHLGRMKLGHWPVLSESNTCLQFVMKCTAESGERDVVMVSGVIDGTDEGVTGLVYLCSLKYLTVRPILRIELLEAMQSIRIRVEILKSLFDECESLLDNARQLWKRSMMSVMAWLRPEVMTSEARYGYSVVENMDLDAPAMANVDSSASRIQMRFEVSSFYEAIKPSKEAPMLEDHLPDLLPELRPYQRRAAYWMVQREKGDFAHLGGDERSQIVSPLCMPLNLIDTSRRIYYNPFRYVSSQYLL
ncbi:UNVERIFIED_CONTAM: hypothetical protein Sindi_2090900 [Sesamum indicum]